MKTTINQLMREFEAIEVAHDQLNTFFRGDLTRAVNENEIVYPLMCAYHTNASIEKKTDPLTITVVIADRVYDGLENLNDTDSDTLQVCRDVINVMRKSPRWQKIGRVQSVSTPKFFEDSADKVCGHAMQIQFVLFDTESICDLPMSGYDFEGSFQPSCAPVTVTDSDGITVVEVDSGGVFECKVIYPVTGQNSDDSYSFTANSGDNVYLHDIEVSLADGVQVFPSVQDIDLSNYAPVVPPPAGTRTPVNIVTDPTTQVVWETLVNTSTTNGKVEKISGGTGWNAKANFKISTTGEFKIEFKLNGSDSFAGVTYADINASYTDIQYAISISGTTYYLYCNGNNISSFGGYVSTDIQRIDRLNNEIRFYVNNVLKYTLTTAGNGANSNGHMLFDCSLYQVTQTVEDILLTFL
tara:strand:- start:80 stop:1312 length:1233 start_codon:yes stop_codon:yes gene_type:complete